MGTRRGWLVVAFCLVGVCVFVGAGRRGCHVGRSFAVYKLFDVSLISYQNCLHFDNHVMASFTLTRQLVVGVE